MSPLEKLLKDIEEKANATTNFDTIKKLVTIIKRQQEYLNRYALVTVATYNPIDGRVIIEDKNFAKEALEDCENILKKDS